MPPHHPIFLVKNMLMSFQLPPVSRSQVAKAGKAIEKGHATRDDEVLVQQWRDAHAHILNTFQAQLRGWIRRTDMNVVFVQRLKRLSTIRNKLQTGRGTFPNMNDIAGCRLIFHSVKELENFRVRYLAESRAAHERISTDALGADKYNYIRNPKPTGYRGVHDVFKYVGMGQAEPYSGLRVEIQYRTLAQHAWATALETADAIDRSSIKFQRQDGEWEDPDRVELFRAASEIIARQEGCRGCLLGETDEQLLDRLVHYEQQTGVLHRLAALSKQTMGATITKKHVVLQFDKSLLVKQFSTANQAVQYRNLLELTQPELDLVYVKLEKPRQLDNAFRNYYRDAGQFLHMLPRVWKK